MKRVYDTKKNEYVMVEDDTPVGKYKPNITKGKTNAPSHNEQRAKNKRNEQVKQNKPVDKKVEPRKDELDEKTSRLINEALMKGIR